MPSTQDVLHVALVGAGATAMLDVWLLVLERLGVPTSSLALVGRWVGHFGGGRFVHPAIARATPIANERGLGWLVHYAVGMAFAAIPVALYGVEWVQQPSFLPALATGLATVVVPLFVMQPAMGSGFAASRTPTPLRNCLRSVANHAVFGCGLYAAAAILAWGLK